MTASPQPEPTSDPTPASIERAEALFATWAARAEAGEDEDFDSLVAGHPELAAALGRLHADWRVFAPILGQVVPGVVASESGLVLPSLSSGPDDSEEGATPELLTRLGIRAPEAGRYRFRGVLGQGGGGVVLKVWDSKLNRPLAMKVVLGRGEERPGGDTPRLDGRTLSRFVDEARIASQLNHPGIVPVHELGSDESGRAFFTMRLVRGEDLGTVFGRVRSGAEGWNLPRALAVLLRVCEAMAYAHDKGVIHRDLKPANVMVGRFGEVHVMDWGLARVLGEPERRDLRIRPAVGVPASMVDSLRRAEREASPDSPLVTMEGTVIGTPSYMAPEQARGQLELVGVQADVYALGAMLYHLLTGQPPYVPSDARVSPQVILAAVIQGPPPPLSSFVPAAPAELVAICEKAMERDLQRRYSGVEALASDLRALLEGRVVGAYESGALAVLRKWIMRNQVLAVASLSVLVLSVGSAILLLVNRQVAPVLQQLKQLHDLATRVQHFVAGSDLLENPGSEWPPHPDKIPGYRRWLESAHGLEAEIGSVDEAISALQARPSLSELDHLLIYFLGAARPRFEHVGRRMLDVERALAAAEALDRRTDEAAVQWRHAIASIASSKRYGGLTIEPQLGLLPLREDPRSGLWEFWHVLSGEKPELDPEIGRWRIEQATGVVLVLIPGGEYVVGASEGDEFVRRYQDQDRDLPAQTVLLEPYFLSKYELTQAQWERAGAANESRHLFPTNPVEMVSCERAGEILPRLDLELPTEAQWEAGARGGTRTRFYSGDDPESLSGHVVLKPDLAPLDNREDRGGAGEIVPRFGQDWQRRPEPVGGREPNPFGLHDVVGNVSEWCRDEVTLDPSVAMRDGDGLREPGTGTVLRIPRGGNFDSSWPAARHSHRFPWAKGNREPDTGLRPVRALR